MSRIMRRDGPAKRTSVSLPPKHMAWLDDAAARDHNGRSGVIRQMIDAEMKNEKDRRAHARSLESVGSKRE